MREIKFRAWLKNVGIMLSVYVLDQTGNACSGTHFEKSKGYGEHGGQFVFNIDDAELMQYVGLKDKNGKEVYEGDLLRYPGDPEHFTAYEVFFHDGDANSDFNIGFSCSRTHHQGSICGGSIPSFKPKSVCQMIICGNIHEHKHLLK